MEDGEPRLQRHQRGTQQRTAAERRQQARRAQARVVQSLLRGFHELTNNHAHQPTAIGHALAVALGHHTQGNQSATNQLATATADSPEDGREGKRSTPKTGERDPQARRKGKGERALPKGVGTAVKPPPPGDVGSPPRVNPRSATTNAFPKVEAFQRRAWAGSKAAAFPRLTADMRRATAPTVFPTPTPGPSGMRCDVSRSAVHHCQPKQSFLPVAGRQVRRHRWSRLRWGRPRGSAHGQPEPRGRDRGSSPQGKT